MEFYEVVEPDSTPTTRELGVAGSVGVVLGMATEGSTTYAVSIAGKRTLSPRRTCGPPGGSCAERISVAADNLVFLEGAVGPPGQVNVTVPHSSLEEWG